jgi:hypothetical protein
MATMQQIESKAEEFARARALLAGVCAAFQQELATVKARYIDSLKGHVSEAKARHAELGALLQESPELFVRPRSVVFHGIKLGYQKGKGKMVIEDEDKTIALIEKHFADQAEVLITITKKVAKKALEQLSAADLKKVAVLVTASGDEVFAKDASADVDKIVAAFLKDDVAETSEAAPVEERAAA